MNITFSYNGRLEIRFQEIPSKQIRYSLKERGFWWDSGARVWYLARPVSMRIIRNEPFMQDGFKWALEMCMTYLGMTAEQAATLTKARDFAAQQAGEQGMEAACGII